MWRGEDPTCPPTVHGVPILLFCGRDSIHRVEGKPQTGRGCQEEETQLKDIKKAKSMIPQIWQQSEHLAVKYQNIWQ